MTVFGWIGLGLLVGALAKLIMPGKDPGGLIVTVLIGIAGAMIGGAIGQQLGWGDVTGFDVRIINSIRQHRFADKFFFPQCLFRDWGRAPGAVAGGLVMA